MRAELVYDGQADVYYKPECMGEPKETQLQGTARECVTELCGRICYDSLGKGRSSADYHAHIAQVGHGSVNEHTPITVGIALFSNEIDSYLHKYYHILLNRPGVYAIPEDRNTYLHWRITANFRAINEWDEFRNLESYDFNELHTAIGNALRTQGHKVAPQIVPKPDGVGLAAKLLEPEYPQEKWITLYMSGSRGFSHEQVRHGDFTAISQRSTRYVDESESEWCWHPLINQFIHSSIDGDELSDFTELLEETQETCNFTYDRIVEKLQPWMQAKGADKLAARKQARGAARGFLGNALKTEMMFSASVDQWHRMLHQRASGFADAEIREIYARETGSVIEALQKSQWSDDFMYYKVVESDDGIGTCLVKMPKDEA